MVRGGAGILLILLQAPSATSAVPGQPQGLGPQALWPTAVLENRVTNADKLNAALASCVQRFPQSGKRDESGDQPGSHFLKDCLGARGAGGRAARFLVKFFEGSCLQYFKESLRDTALSERIDVQVDASWVTFLNGSDHKEATVQPHAAIKGTYFAECGSVGGQTSCGVVLEDPRPPAGIADLPHAVRARLGFGTAQRRTLGPGSVLIYPPWVVHRLEARGGAGDAAGDGAGSAVAVSFTATVRVRERGSPPQRPAADEL